VRNGTINPANHDLRAFVKEIESIGQLHRIEGTPWDKRHGRSRRDDSRAQQTRARNEAAQLQAVMDTSVIEEVRKSGFIDKLYDRAPKNER